MFTRILVLFSIISWSFPLNAEISPPLTIDNAIRYSFENNPNLAAIDARFQAMTYIPSQVSALPEPKFKFNIASLPLDSFALDQTPMTQLQVGITQALPYPGKLALKSEAAQYMATATHASWLDAKRMLTQQIKHQWWGLFYLDHALEILEQNTQILDQFIEVAETKYSVGKGLQQDILLAQVESYKLQDKKLQLKSLRQTTQANLNQLMGKKQNQFIFIRKNKKDVIEKMPSEKKISDFIETANKYRPDIKRANLLANAAESRLKLANKDYYPNFQLGALYGWRKEQTGLASLQFSMNIPWDIHSRQNPARDQRNQEWMQQKYALQALQNKIAEEITSAKIQYQTATQQMTLFTEAIIPQAEQMVEAMLAGYQVNNVDFLNLLQAQITLFNYEIQYWKAYSTANQSLAALDAAIGKEIKVISHE